MKEMMEKDILTTADTAKLLGVSVRTAQLLIEGGSLPSWKTPGGHRRVFRRDVETIVAGGKAAPAAAGARVLAIVGDALGAELRTRFDHVGECLVDYAADAESASRTIERARPRALVVDATSGECAAIAKKLVRDGVVRREAVVFVEPGADVSGITDPAASKTVGSAEAAIEEIRAMLADPPERRISAESLPYPIALNEEQRLVALERSGLVDTAPEDAFDRIVWLAAHTLGAPIALVSLLTPTRQFFKSRFGLDLVDTPRSVAFCNETMLQKGVFAVEDLSADPRYAANPYVAGGPNFRFYAGAPIFDAGGFALGSLCVIDYAPRRLDPHQTRALGELAALATSELRLRHADDRLRDMLRRAERSGAGPASADQPAAFHVGE